MGDGEGAKGGAPKPAAKLEPPKLPDGTPDPIKKFVACQAGGIRFKGGPLPFVKGNPKVSFEPGEKAGTVKVSVGWGIASLPVTAEVKDGKLSIDASKVPDLSDFIDDAPKPKDFTDFADKLNEWLKANGKQLGPLELKDGQLTIRKQAVPAAGKAAQPAAPAPPPAPKPKEQGVKTGPGLGTRTAAGVGSLVLGFTIGALAAPGAEQTSQAQPDEPVPVVRAQQPQQMPVEERVVVQLPPGDVQGEITITGPPGSFTTTAVFRQTGNKLTMELPQSGLPPFKGLIDEAVEFEIRNQSGLFAGRFQGDRVMGDHEFQGEPFTFQGTIEKPVVEKIVTDGPPPQETVPVAGGIRNDVALGPVAVGDQSGSTVAGVVGGLLLMGLGAGLIVADARSGAGARSCDEERAALDRAMAAHQNFLAALETAQERWHEASQRAEEAMGRLEGALPPGYNAGVSQMGTVTVEQEGGFIETMAEMMAPKADKEWQDIRDEAQSEFDLARTYEEDIQRLEAQIAVALQEVLDREALLARCEGRAPRSDVAPPPPKPQLPEEPGPVVEVM